MADDPQFDQLLRAIKNEESKALMHQSRVLRDRAADAIAVSRRLRNNTAAFGDSVAKFLQLGKR